MAWLIKIGPTGALQDRTASIKVDAVDILLTYNERSIASFVTLPGYLPSLRDEVEIYETDGSTLLFGGLVYQRRTNSVIDRITCEVDCADWSVYGDWTYTDRSYADNTTLQTVLNDLITDCFGQFGVSLDATDYTGVTLTAFAWANKNATDALRELSDKTGYIWRITPQKVLTLVLPGASAAAFNLSDATPNCDTLEWQDSSEKYATKVRVICGPDAVLQVTQTWIADGTTTSWVTDFPSTTALPSALLVGGAYKTLAPSSAIKAWQYLGLVSESVNLSDGQTATFGAQTYTFKTALTPTAGEVLIGGTGRETLEHLINAINGGDGSGTDYAAVATNATVEAFWERPYRPWILLKARTAGVAGNAIVATSTIPASTGSVFWEGGLQYGVFAGGVDAADADYAWDAPSHTLSVADDPTPAAGTIIALTYTAQFPFTVTAGGGATPEIEHVVTAPEIMTLAAGQELADGLIAKLSGSLKTITFLTRTAGLVPGAALSIVLADRQLNIPVAWIQIVDIHLVRSEWWEYRVTAIESDEYIGSYLDYFRIEGVASGTAVAGSASGSVTVSGISPYYLGGSRFHAVQVAS